MVETPPVGQARPSGIGIKLQLLPSFAASRVAIGMVVAQNILQAC